MVEFDFRLENRYTQWHNDANHWDLEYEGVFEIRIDGKIFFRDPCFLVLEFLKHALDWVLKIGNMNMEYNCIETEDNPLISFLHVSNNKWRIYSQWQFFECNELFRKEELCSAVRHLKSLVDVYRKEEH